MKSPYRDVAITIKYHRLIALAHRATIRPMTHSAWLENYKASHQHPVNRGCHTIGIPMIVASLPTIFFSWPWALGLFVVGWLLQFVGHGFEGKPPAFFSDARYLVVGPYWWLKRFFRR